MAVKKNRMINKLSDIAILTIFHRLDFTFGSLQKITKICTC